MMKQTVALMVLRVEIGAVLQQQSHRDGRVHLRHGGGCVFEQRRAALLVAPVHADAVGDEPLGQLIVPVLLVRHEEE